MTKYLITLLLYLVLVNFSSQTYAQCTTCGTSTVFVGTNAGLRNENGVRNVFIGHSAGELNLGGVNNTFVGDNSGTFNTGGHSNSFFGRESGRFNKASFNSFFGAQAGTRNNSGTKNSFFGTQAGYVNTNGSHNSFFGHQTGSSVTEGSNNAFFGYRAGHLSTQGNNNTFLGAEAGYRTKIGEGNSFVGVEAGKEFEEGDFNVLMGAYSGRSLEKSDFNVFVGSLSGQRMKTGQRNTFLGASAGANSNGNRNVFIGYLAGLNEKGSNKLYIANNEERAPLIYGDFAIGRVGYNTTEPQDELHVKDGADANTSATIFVQPQEWNSVGDFGEIRIGDPYHFIRGEFGNGMIINDFNQIDFRTGGVKSKTRLLIDYTGNIGVGTHKPRAKLHTVGTLRFQDLPTGNGQALVVDEQGNVKRSSGTALKSDPTWSEKLDSLEAENREIKARLLGLEALLSTKSGMSVETPAKLYQNRPNPFDQATEIAYFIPEEIQEASLYVYDWQGKVIKTIPLDERGEQKIKLQARSLPAGTYYYTLIIEGQRIETHRMMLTE